MTTFLESFNGSTTDQSWTALRDQYPWTLNGDGTATIANAGGNTYQRLNDDVGSTDHYAEVVLQRGWANTANGDPRSVLILRAGSSTAQTYYAVSLQLTNNLITFLYWNNGAASPFGSTINSPITIPPSGPLTFRFEVEGSTFRAYLNGSLVKTETDTRRSTGTYTGAGVQRGTTIRFDQFRTGALSGIDPDPDPEPGDGGGLPDLVETYQDLGTGGSTRNTTVPGVLSGDTLLTVATDSYSGNPAIAANGQTWSLVGAVLGNNDGETNQWLKVWRADPTTSGSVTVTVSVSTSDMSTLTVLHLRNVADIVDVSDHVIPRNANPAATQALGPVTVPDGGAMLVGAWAGIQFSGTISWDAQAGMTELPELAVNQFNAVRVAHEDVTTPGSVTRTATASLRPDSGFAGKLLAITGQAEEPGPTTAAEAQDWGDPLPASDEFDTPGAPDPAKWSVYGAGGDVGGDECWVGHDGNGRRCVSQATVTDDGYLRLTGTAGGDTGALSHKLDQQYGRWEVRARVLAETGATGNPYHGVLIVWPYSNKWPIHGEYDFLEVNVGDTAATAWLHYPHPGNVEVQQERGRKTGVDVADWHNYALEWTPDELIGYLDGQEWFRFSGGSGPNGRGPIQGMPAGHLTLQLDDFFPQAGLQAAYLDVDWARVYPAPIPGPGVRVTDVGEQWVGAELVHVATELGDGVTARSWTVTSGPAEVGSVLSTDTALWWNPSVAGQYMLEYTATNAAGSSSDQLRVTVRGPEPGRMLLAT